MVTMEISRNVAQMGLPGDERATPYLALLRPRMRVHARAETRAYQGWCYIVRIGIQIHRERLTPGLRYQEVQAYPRRAYGRLRPLYSNVRFQPTPQTRLGAPACLAYPPGIVPYTVGYQYR
jgi:hypothetical protein